MISNKKISHVIVYFAYIPAILWMYVIAGFSADTATQSSSLSLTVTEGIVDIIDIGNNLTEEEYNDMVENLHTPVRKVAHMTEYAILYILLLVPMIITIRKRYSYTKVMISALVVCAVYASFDELHQLFVEGRSCQFTDVLIDTAGATVSMILSFGVNKFTNRKKIYESK